MKNWVARPILEFHSAEIARVLTSCFEGYLLPVEVNAVGFERRFRAEHLDAVSSFIYSSENQPQGIIFIARRGKHSRVAAMGVVTDARGTGLGRLMLGNALQAATERGDKNMVLEVFEQNTRAVGLYTSLGFQIVRPLLGYARVTKRGIPEHLTEIDALEFSRVAAQETVTGLPWMLTPENFAGQYAKAFQLEDKAFALVSEAGNSSFILHGLFVRKAFRRQKFATRLLNALTVLFGGKDCKIAQVVPSDLMPEFLESVGFTISELRQFEMKHNLF